jgi:hypothetical protein
MATKRTGRPCGRPELKLLDDPDRYRLAIIDATMESYGLKFEPAARLVLSVAESVLVPPGKGKLSRSRERLLKRGWKLQTFKRVKQTPKIDSQIDTLRLKSKRFATDEPAHGWLHNMRNAWINLLRYDRIGPAAELLIFKCAEAAGESAYAKDRMLPFLRRLTSL